MLQNIIQKARTWFFAQTLQTRAIVVFFGVFAVWMLSGAVFGGSAQKATTPLPMLVSTQLSTAKAVPRVLTLEGDIRPNRSVTLKAKTTGTVVAIHVQKGNFVKKGQLLFSLAPDDRPARLQEAKSNVMHRQLEFKTAAKLGRQGFESGNRVAQAQAALDKAKAELKTLQDEVSHTQIRAPFAGFLQQQHIEVGNALALGDPLGDVIDINPLLLVGYIPQDKISMVQPESLATGVLVNQEVIQGKIRYLSAQADPQTRTYGVEIEVANPQQKPLAGSSVRIELPLGDVQGHFISAAYLSLADNGTLGVKTLGPAHTAHFMPITIEQTTPEGVWVGGLPEKTTLITLGHGFVKHGQKVRTTAKGEAE